jgi:dethiobiotin synthetase/adenosylmethionine--8-amino-7-oxononanoate aminotransferase
MSLKDPNGSGYASTAATGLRDKLLAGNGQDEAVIHSRVLGNVLYLMAALNTPEKTLHEIQDIVLEALE